MKNKIIYVQMVSGKVLQWLSFPVFFIPVFNPHFAYATSEQSSDIVQFNMSFIDTSYTGNIDIKQFSQGNGLIPGKYLVDIYLNDNMVGTERVTFSKQQNDRIVACMTPEILSRLTIQPTALHEAEMGDARSCTPVETVIPSAHVTFDSAQQQLKLAVPQKDLLQTARGSVPPSLWQDGSAGAFVSYNASTYQVLTKSTSFNSQYVNLNAGFNLDEWYFRHNGALTKQTGLNSEYQSQSTYVQHDVSAIQGRFLAGQAATSGRLFDSVNYTGVSVFSDDKMLPASMRGYAPEIRGIARSNARVTVRQSGNIIYEASVPPGAFVINDLYPTGYGGDLNVTVRESDGSENIFLVPYASVADLLRPGTHRYEGVVGKYRAQGGVDGQPFYQATWQQGLTNILSLYGGLQLSNGYQAYQIGGAISTPLGAIAADGTQANTKTVNDSLKGQSYRVTWSKLVSDTQSNISLAAYRFSTRDYLDFSQAMQYQNLQRGESILSGLLYRTKNRYSLTLSQGLPEGWGVLSASGISQNYWDRTENNLQYQVGYSNRWRKVTYSITANRSRNQNGATDTSWALQFSVPLGDERPVTLNAGLTRDMSGNYGEQASLSGTAGENQQFSWGISGNHSEQSGSSGSLNGQYSSPWSSFSGAASTSRTSHTISAGMSGAIVAHPHGITFTPYNSDTWVVVHAPGASGAQINGYPGLKLDHWGNAAIPSSMPYERNSVGLDPKDLPDTVELENTSAEVIPRSGAIVVTQFKTRQGYALLLTPTNETVGLPFGANVTDEKGNNLGMVGQGGVLYARAESVVGKLFSTIQRNGKPFTCIIPFEINKSKNGFYESKYSCS